MRSREWTWAYGTGMELGEQFRKNRERNSAGNLTLSRRDRNEFELPFCPSEILENQVPLKYKGAHR